MLNLYYIQLHLTSMIASSFYHVLSPFCPFPGLCRSPAMKYWLVFQYISKLIQVATWSLSGQGATRGLERWREKRMTPPFWWHLLFDHSLPIGIASWEWLHIQKDNLNPCFHQKRCHIPSNISCTVTCSALCLYWCFCSHGRDLIMKLIWLKDQPFFTS